MTRSPTDVTSGTLRLTSCALMAALALGFSYLEFLIPFPVGIPGVKLGLANLVILLVLYRLGAGYALAVDLVRIILAGVTFTGLYALIYSLAGGMFSLLVMILLKKTGLFSLPGVSMAGGVAHNFGQVAVAAVMISSGSIFAYFPLLVFTGMASGLLLGIVAYVVNKRLPQGVFPDNAALQ